MHFPWSNITSLILGSSMASRSFPNASNALSGSVMNEKVRGISMIARCLFITFSSDVLGLSSHLGRGIITHALTLLAVLFSCLRVLSRLDLRFLSMVRTGVFLEI
jgi:hypothetical protein